MHFNLGRHKSTNGNRFFDPSAGRVMAWKNKRGISASTLFKQFAPAVKTARHFSHVIPRSLMIQAVRHTHDDLEMPPKEPLTESEIRTLEEWVLEGAAWPAPVGGSPSVKILPPENTGTSDSPGKRKGRVV